MKRPNELIGNRYGKLVVIDFIGYVQFKDRRRSLLKCICDCGNVTQKHTGQLKGNCSCGCVPKEVLAKMSESNKKHNMSNTRLYGCYKAMKSRCYRIKDIHYNAYGGRGITVCDSWKSNSKNFIDWALENGYRDDLTLERINVNGNYCPENCTWIPMKEQYKNKQHRTLPQPPKGEEE